MYRISPSQKNNIHINQFNAEDGDQIVVFALLKTQKKYETFDQPIYLRGLNPNAQYEINAFDKQKLVEKIQVASGSYLLEHGLKFRFPRKDMNGTVFVMEKLQ